MPTDEYILMLLNYDISSIYPDPSTILREFIKSKVPFDLSFLKFCEYIAYLHKTIDDTYMCIVSSGFVTADIFDTDITPFSLKNGTLYLFLFMKSFACVNKYLK